MRSFISRISSSIRLLAILIPLAALSIPAGAAAAQEKSITLSPANTAISVDPGGSSANSMSVLNNGKSSYTVNISTSPFHVNGVDYDPRFSQLPGTTDASKWIKLSTTKAVVNPGQTVPVQYTVNVPKGTQPGGYYAVVFAATQPTTKGKGVQSSNRVGNILYITVKGNVQKSGGVASVSLPGFTTSSKLPISIDVKNTGGVHFVTDANITVKNIYGKQAFNGKYQRYVLPQTVRRITAQWTTPAFGIYHVSRNATVFGQTKSVPDQTVVVMHPWVLIVLGALVVFIVLMLVLPRLIRKRK